MPGNFKSIPVTVIEHWPKPNYVDPVRRQWMPAFAGTLIALETVIVAGRFYLRARRQAGGFGLDDLLISIGWIFSVAFSTITIVEATRFGLDRHTWDVPIDRFSSAALYGWIAQILFGISTCATKSSVLLFYRRIVKDSYSRRSIYAIWAALAFIVLYFLGTLLAYCLICTPLDAYWLTYDYRYNQSYTCINGGVLVLFVGPLSVVSDLVAVVLPFLILRPYSLKISRRQRICLNMIFALGTFVAAAGIARTYYLWELDHTYDTSWTGFDLSVWCLVECDLAIICACAPSLRAFFRCYLRVPLDRSSGRSSSEGWGKDMENSPEASYPRQSEASTCFNEASKPCGETSQLTKITERALTRLPFDGRDFQRFDFASTRTQSSDVVPRIRAFDDCDVDATSQSPQHGLKASIVTTSLESDEVDPEQRDTHDMV